MSERQGKGIYRGSKICSKFVKAALEVDTDFKNFSYISVQSKRESNLTALTIGFKNASTQ